MSDEEKPTKEKKPWVDIPESYASQSEAMEIWLSVPPGCFRIWDVEELPSITPFGEFLSMIYTLGLTEKEALALIEELMKEDG
jgi:hypothetical protein